jgi:hypothetical protein
LAEDVQSKLYFADGGKSIKDELKAAGEDTLPLTKWWFEQDRVHDLSMRQFWDVGGG